MFDLFRSRDKFVRFSLGALLVIVALSMLLYLIPGAGMPNVGNNDQVVAEVGDSKITVQQVYRRIQSVFRNNPVPPDVVEIYVPQLIEAMIADRAVAYQAQHMGFVVDDNDVVRMIRSFPQLGTLTPDQYRAAIEQMGFTVPEFEGDLRKQVYENTLTNIALSGVIVTPKEIENAYKETNEKVKISYIAFTPDKFKSQVNPTQADLESYYSAKKFGFSIPESRNVQAIVIDQAKVEAGIQIPDAQLQAYYDAHREQYRTPERVKVRHILLQTTGKSPAEVEKIKAQAEDLLKQIKSGANFGDLAKKYSQDPGSAQNGGELGWIARGQTVKNFENSAFSLKPGETSPVITTEYGFHILQVLDKEPAGLQPFDKVKDQIASELKKQSVNDKMQSLADQARAQLLKTPGDAAGIAAKLGVEAVKADNVTPTSGIPQVGASKDLTDAITALGKGQVSQVIQVSPTRLAVAAVTAVNPAHTPPLSEVEGRVRDAYVNEKAIQIAQQKAQEAANALQKNGGDLEAVAKSMGLEVKSSDLFTRNGAIHGVGSASYFSAAFTKPVGSVIGPVNAAGQTVVAKVTDKVEPDMNNFAAQREQIFNSLKQKKAEERNSLLQDSILNSLIQKGKVKIYKNVENEIIQRYRAS